MELSLEKLMQAIKSKDIETISEYLGGEGGDIINLTDSLGQTPLTYAAKLGDCKVVYELCRSMFCENDSADRNGDIAIEIAISNGNKELANTLLSMGYLCNDEERLDLILRAGVAIPESNSCTINMAKLVLNKVKTLTDEERIAYEIRADIRPPYEGASESNFNVELMLIALVTAISNFSSQHSDKEIAAFAIDAGACSFGTRDDVEQNCNVADWSYYLIELEDGFDFDAYEEHCEEERSDSTYALAMLHLVEKLKAVHAFNKINTTEDFKIQIITEHEY